MKVALYARVSTSNQNTSNQLLEVREAIKRNGWTLAHELVDHGISGAKNKSERPAFAQLHRLIARREVDIVAVWSIDRLGRSIQDLVQLMGELEAKRIHLYSHKQAIDTSTPAGRMTFAIFASIAEFERELIKERINAGIARARSEGKKLGRPSNMNDNTRIAVKLLREKGSSIHSIAKKLSIGVGTTRKILSEAA
jgi:DNA invertase Pin-like site-specific DNA recombinase